jgi:glycyl-tRNA synthetase
MDKYEKIIELAKRRGYIWPSFEIYGGIAGFYDYGPYGARLKRRLEERWRSFYLRVGFSEIETPTMSPEEVFIASGHANEFTDEMVECSRCGERFRLDLIPKGDFRCPECGGALGNVQDLTLMFDTRIGTDQHGYLRPETAQGIFIDFNRLLKFHRGLPFGVIQTGKAYRNEISPRQGIIRLREFTLAEVEIFIDPSDKHHPSFEDVEDVVLRLLPSNMEEMDVSVSDAVKEGILQHEYIAYHITKVYEFLKSIGIAELRFRQHTKDEMAHYAKDCWDAEVLTDRFGWVEVVGVADRGGYDLTMHEKASDVKMEVFIPYENPKSIERLIIKPNMRVIGPIFKERAKYIIESLKKLDIEDFKADRIDLEINEEKVSIDRNLVEYETVQETVTGENILPHVIEPSYGIDRILYVLLEHSFHEEEVDGERRTVLRLPIELAPVQVAVLPLLNKDALVKRAREIVAMLREEDFIVEYDDSGSIGRRYRRQDEIGTPRCITVDHESLDDDTVTIRDRDTMKQVRVKIDALINALA